MAEVYYTNEMTEESVTKLFEKISNGQFAKDDKVAIKVHFGEKGNTRYVPPKLIKPIIDVLKKENSSYFLTDSNTLYRGSRLTAKEHLETARSHGFGELGTDIVIGDGEIGDEETEVQIDKEIFKAVKIGKRIADSDAVIAVSHFKGHMLFGFGGALKNISMGCASRAGKLAMHSSIKPSINSDSCTQCGTCSDNCPVDAIDIEKGEIDDSCIGCAKCISVCPVGAVNIPWHGATSKQAQERAAEYAYGAVHGKKAVYITFIKNITKDCDCLKDSEIIADDLGIAASLDPVSADQAAFDLLKEREGKDIFLEENKVDGTHILEHAEKIGLGERNYSLVRL